MNSPCNEEILNAKDIKLAKLSKIVHVCGAKVLNEVAKDLYRLHPHSQNGTLLLENFCKTVTGKSIKKETGRKNFPSDFRFEYDEAQREELSIENKLDISFCCAVIDICMKKNCDDFLDTNASLLETIKSVKNIRNELCHDYGFDEELIEKYKGYMLKHIRDICSHMENLLLRNNKPQNLIVYNSLSKSVTNRVKNIWKSRIINANELSKYNELPEVEEYLKSLILAGCLELKKRYEPILFASSISLDESFSAFPVNDVFTPVSMRVEEMKITYEEILTYNSQKKNTSPPAVVICGHAGRGKTTICKKLTYDWCYNNSLPLKHYDLLLHIEVKRAEEKGVIEYIKSVLLPDTLYEKDSEEVFFFLRQTNVLFIIDGYDEKSKQADYIIRELLQNLSEKKFVITTRPHSAKDVFCALKRQEIIFLNISLEGFQEDELKMFVDKIWELLFKEKKINEPVANFYSILATLPINIYELMKVPLICVMLIYLFMKNKLKKNFQFATRSIIYDQVFQLLSEEVVKKIKIQIEDKKPEHLLSKDAQDLVSVFAEQCFRLSKKNIYIIDSEMISRIDEILREKDLSECKFIILSSYFLCTPNIRRKIEVSRMNAEEVASEYEFFHKTQMEYLIAYHCVHSGNNTKLEINELIVNKDELIYDVLPFVVGQLTIKKRLDNELVKSIFKVFESIIVRDQFSLYWNLLSEARYINDDHYNEQYNAAICDAMKNTLSTSLWKLNGKNVVSGLKLLEVIEIKIGALEIAITEDSNPFDIPTLSKTWSNLTHKLKGRYSPQQTGGKNNKYRMHEKQRTLELELHFKAHEIRGKDPSDFFLENLEPWGVLKKFSGYLGENGVECLKNCCSIRHINARFTSVEVFNDFNNICKSKKSYLRNVNLTFDFNPIDSPAKASMFHSHTIPALKTVTFNGLKKRNLDWAANILTNIHNEECCIESVYLLKTSLDPKEFHKQFLMKVKDVIGHKLKVQSSVPISEEQYEKMNKLAIVEWMG